MQGQTAKQLWRICVGGHGEFFTVFFYGRAIFCCKTRGGSGFALTPLFPLSRVMPPRIFLSRHDLKVRFLIVQPVAVE